MKTFLTTKSAKFAKFFVLCALCVLCGSTSAQSIITAEGLAAFGTNAVTGGGGGDYLTGVSIRLVGDGSTATDFVDLSGNGIDAVPLGFGASNPTLASGVANGHDALLFNGTSDSLGHTSVAASFVASTSAVTVFAVVKQTGGVIAGNDVFRWNPSSPLLVQAANSGNINLFSSGSQISKAQPANWADGNFHIVEAYRSGTTYEIIVDGTSLGTGTASGSISTSSGNFIVGAASENGSSSPFKGYIVELRIYPSDIGSGNRSTARAALKAKYGTP